MTDMELEHPDITEACRSGYHRVYVKHICYECDSCGEPLTNSEWYIEVGGERLCNFCVMQLKSDPSDAVIEIEEEPDWFDERRRKLDV